SPSCQPFERSSHGLLRSNRSPERFACRTLRSPSKGRVSAGGIGGHEGHFEHCSAPPPLSWGGWEGVRGLAGKLGLSTPTLNPSPQGGGRPTGGWVGWALLYGRGSIGSR